jgi:membrane protein
MSMALRFAVLLRKAFWRAVLDNCFTIAKAAAYSSILTFFPALLVFAAVLAATQTTEAFLREVSYGIGFMLPPGTRRTALAYFDQHAQHSLRVLLSASSITLMAASGVMLSWMQGFRKAYDLPQTWGFWKERGIALLLVASSFIPMTFATILVAFGNQIENWMVFHTSKLLGPYILLMWVGIRWLIASLTSIAVMAVIYHYGIPRTQPWYKVVPGAIFTTAMWFVATVFFSWYVRNVASYSLIYGSLGAGIALLVWMYLISIIVLVGAEFNALLFPREATRPSGTQRMPRLETTVQAK